MNTMNTIASFPLSDPMIQRIAWTLIHFVWQGLAIAFLLIVAVRIAQVRRSSWRYACSLSALVVMVAMAVITFLVLSPGPNPDLSTPVIKQGPTAQEAPLNSPMQNMPAAVSVAADRIDPPTKHVESASQPASATDDLTPITNPHQSLRLPLAWKWVQPSIVIGWFAGVALLSLRLLIGWLGILRLRRQIDEGPGWLVDRMIQLADQLHMPSPLLRVGHRVTEAIAIGFVKPMILLPMAWVTEMPPDMLDAVLAHELAHIRRHDLWIILFQRLVETLLFYHPAVWWLSRRLRMEREMCCDELVVQVTQNPLRYAETLEHIGRLSVASQRAILAVSIAAPRSLLVERVRNILRLRPHEQSSWAWLVALVPLMLVGVTCWTALPTRESSALADENAKPATEKPNVEPDEPANSNESKITLKGKVLDDRGKPVADADVIMFQKADVNTDAPPVKVLATKTDQQGIFQLKGSQRLFQSAVVWSVVPWEQTWTGPGLGWGVHLAHTRDNPVAPDATPVFELPKDSPDRFVIRLNRKPGRIRLEDPRLKPVAGAKVVVTALTPPKSDLANLEELESELRLGKRSPRYNFSEWIHVPIEFRGMLTGSTGPDGVVALEGVEPNRIAGLRVETESHGLQMVPRDYSNPGNQDPYRFRLSPVGRAEGKVVVEPRAHSAGFRTEGMKLTFRTSNPSNLRSQLSDERATDNMDVIDRGDVIEVSISDDLGEMEAVTLPVRVNDQGIANLPKIGSVALGGLETKAAETKIAAACIDRKLFPRPKVTVTMKRQMNRAMVGAAIAIVDAAGNFSVPSIAHGFIELENPLPKDSLYFLASPLNARVPAGQLLKLSLSVNKKVKALGRVLKRGSDEPIATTVMLTQFHGSGFRNPHSQLAKTDEKGFYEALVHPGLIEMRPHSPIDGWATVFAWEHEHPRSALALHHEVADSDDVARLPSVDLVPTQPLTGKLVDQQGDAVEARWEIVGFPSQDGLSCAHAVTRDGGEFKLIVPSSYPPTRFMARRKTQPFHDDHRVYNIRYGVNVVSQQPLVLQIPGTAKQAPPIVGDRTDALPKLSPTELGTARKKRLAGNDTVAAKTLVGDWKMKLPKGFVYSMTLKQREDGCLILSSENEKNVTCGVFTFKDKRLELLEANRPEVDDLCGKQQTDGSLKLIHEQHRHGANYIGAVLEPVTAKVATDDSGLAIISLRVARGRTNDRAAAPKLVGRWMLTLPLTKSSMCRSSSRRMAVWNWQARRRPV
jgi:beta-lactamase regulating signal transducer with metallopeptidase domain